MPKYFAEKVLGHWLYFTSIKQHYLEMFAKWSEVSQKGYYGEV